MKEGAEIVAAFDADAAGRKLGDVLQQQVEQSGLHECVFVRDVPEGGKDWNELLVAARRPSVVQRLQEARPA